MVLRSEILQTLHASLPSGAAGYGTFRSRLRAIPREAARSLVLDFLQQYLDTGFDDDTWVALTGQGASPLIRTQQIRKIWDALVREDWAPESIERSLSTSDGIERWAWLPRWSLLSQDEDLMLWGFAPELLHAARSPRCPKRHMALSSVAHEVRDTTWGFVLGAPNVANPFERANELLPAARAAGADDLVRYLERLATYTKPGRVSEDEALQRALDVHRCYAPPPASIKVEKRGQSWHAQYSSERMYVRELLIDRHSGAMTAHEQFVPNPVG